MRFPFLPFCLFALTPLAFSKDSLGTLIFVDTFDREESQEEKDEPGNEWTTSSDKTAKGHKQIDLRDGAVYIYTHAEANHATSFRHAFAFRDGSVQLRFKFEDPKDSLILNFADLDLKSVHAGHLFKITIGTSSIRVTDQKTGEMNLAIRKARQAGTVTEERKKSLEAKSKAFSQELAIDEWHEVRDTIRGDELTCSINGEIVGSFRSDGFAHETKKLLRLLVPRNSYIDDVKIWKSNS
jgi:hypothetical protein